MLLVKEALQKQIEKGIPVIIVSHDYEFMELVCDRIIRLEKNNIE